MMQLREFDNAYSGAERRIRTEGAEFGDCAPAGEAAGIRSLTRVLEHLEQNLRDPHWLLEPTQTTSARLAGRQ